MVCVYARCARFGCSLRFGLWVSMRWCLIWVFNGWCELCVISLFVCVWVFGVVSGLDACVWLIVLVTYALHTLL